MSSPITYFNFSTETRSCLITMAVGEEYSDTFERYSLSSWKPYIERWGIGLAVVHADLLPKSDPYFKNPSWQKLLAPARVLEDFSSLEMLCLLDYDIVISPLAPNVFHDASRDHFSVVSQEKNLPYPLEEVKKRMAYLRQRFYSPDYPFDSFLFATAPDLFAVEGLPNHGDFFCAGLLVLPRQQAGELRDWFYRVSGSEADSANEWEQTHLNHWVQSAGVHWLPYEYQAIWPYEMAWKYPHLYSEGAHLADNPLALSAVTSCLWNCHFLHFAGTWFENEAWKNSHLPEFSESMETLGGFEGVRTRVPKIVNRGRITPSS